MPENRTLVLVHPSDQIAKQRIPRNEEDADKHLAPRSSPRHIIESHGRELPVSGSPVNVRVHMEPSPGSFAPGECQPIEFCSVDSRTDIPTWIFPTLTSPIELPLPTSADPEHTLRLY